MEDNQTPFIFGQIEQPENTVKICALRWNFYLKIVGSRAKPPPLFLFYSHPFY